MAELEPLEVFLQCFSGWRAGYVENHLEALSSADVTKNSKRNTKAYFKKAIVTDVLYRKHLTGTVGLGVCPVNSANHCNYAVVDIDEYNTNCANYIFKIIQQYALPFCVFSSKSKGLHLYIFFTESESAKEVRAVLKKFVTAFALDKKFIDSTGATKVEIFPKQDVLDETGNGSCVTLPYFNAADPPNPMLAPDGEPVSFELAMKNVWQSRTTLKELDTKLNGLPYGDAPVCIQRGILSDMLEENSGRNDFLYSLAIYLKKKNGKDSLEEDLTAVNGTLPAPITKEDIRAMAASVAKTEKGYKCSGALCKLFCSKKDCAKREFGLGRNRGHFTGVDFGKLIRIKTKLPYYVWELRVNETDPYVPVVFKDSSELHNQTIFLRKCIDELSCAPYQVPVNDWLEVVNTALSHVTNQSISADSDSTGLAMVEKAFIQFLVHKKAPKNSICSIRFGSVVRDILGNYCFSGDAFMAYLAVKNLDMKTLLIRDVLVQFGCTEGTVRYNSASGKVVEISCWKKASDPRITEEENIMGEVEEEDAIALDTAIAQAGAEQAKDTGDTVTDEYTARF